MSLNISMRAVVLLLIFATSIIAIQAQCSVSINGDLPAPQPLVLNVGEGAGFRHPVDTSGTLSFAAGENVRLVCTGTNNKFVNLDSTESDVLATCVSGSKFTVDGVLIEFSELACSFLPWHWQRKSGNTCLGSYTDVEIGFDLGTEWITIINACHDETRLETLYTTFKLVKEIGGFQTGFPRPSWVQGIFYPGYTLATQYNRATQIATMGTLLGSTDLGTQYIHATNDYFLARGHTTAKADFVYGSQHRATFYYVNQSPQWQTFNGGNWNSLENDVRNYVSNTYQDLTVYTGVYGIAQLPNVNGVLTDLYLYADAAGNRAIPVPKFFWKILYNETTQLGTAFIGVNNPYLTTVTSDYYICSDISSQIQWLTWSANSVPLGISYACTVDSLRNVVETIPSFTVKGILS
ncbi:uncharacterized protein LOC124413439 [Diprion similis]|uniref:uncharacterized protein LOC124413439 n=1 Tax=Diprion similis TaxID=362088 RepID=UPI001EF896A0|nr:uncharacterized protein LOC124413439 [Diprion similis]